MTTRRRFKSVVGTIALGDTTRLEVRQDDNGNVDIRVSYKSYGPYWNTGKAGFVLPGALVAELVSILMKVKA